MDASLRQAEDSLRLNPRVREGRLHRVVLRTGLDTLEICTVVLRVIARTLTDLAKQREEEWLLDPEVSMAMRDLLGHVADAVVSFAVLVSTGTSSESEVAEDRLVSHLGAANAQREHVARLLLDTVQEDPSHWQLQGPCSPRSTASSPNSTRSTARSASWRNSTATPSSCTNGTRHSPKY